MNKQIFICLFLCALVTGCSGLKQIDCQSADWALLGFQDGENGIPVSDVEGYQAICTEQGTDMDLDAYQSGYEEGLRVYCQPENGYELGISGQEYKGICPTDLSFAFYQEYREGLRFYPIYRGMNEVQMAITSNTATIGTLQSSIGTDTARLSSPNINHIERNQLRQNIDSMQSQVRAYELANDRLETELANWERALEELKARYGR